MPGGMNPGRHDRHTSCHGVRPTVRETKRVRRFTPANEDPEVHTARDAWSATTSPVSGGRPKLVRDDGFPWVAGTTSVQVYDDGVWYCGRRLRCEVAPRGGRG